MRLCILGHGHTLVQKRGAFWGGIPNCDYHGWSALFALQGGNKKSAKKKNESEMALHCIASMCTNTDVNPAGLKDRDRDRKREES